MTILLENFSDLDKLEPGTHVFFKPARLENMCGGDCYDTGLVLSADMTEEQIQQIKQNYLNAAADTISCKQS